MNFFERQQAARRSSTRLLVLFGLAVLGTALGVAAAVLLGLGFIGSSPQIVATVSGEGPGLLQRYAGTVVVTVLGTMAVIGLASLARTAGLRSGGGVVARELGGTAVSEDTQDPSLRRLRNVVEEMAIASGVPVPEIYVLEQESGINAFAAGWSPADAAVAVTRGALDRLNRDELQGVIAHEFSHVLNGDMRLNIRLVGLLAGILLLGTIGRKVLQHSPRGRNSKGAGPVLLVALLVMVVGYIGVFFGRLIKAGISRSREHLADASAVQFTRQTRGIAGALKKIAGLPDGSRLASTGTEDVSHMLFGDGVGFSSLFATHPPLLDRIRALEPDFDAAQLTALQAQWAVAPPSGLDEDRLLGLAGDVPPPLPQAGAELRVRPDTVVAAVAAPDVRHYHHAERVALALPPVLRAAARAPQSATALVLALVLDADPARRALQLQSIEARLSAQACFEVERLAGLCVDLHPSLRLPLASLALAPLRRQPPAQVEALRQAVADCIHVDGRIELFEYCIGVLLRRQLAEGHDPAALRRAPQRKLAQALPQAFELLAVLAWHGHDDAEAARRAFQTGVARLAPQAAVRYAPPADVPAALDAVWPALDALDPAGKALLLDAMVVAASQDGRMSVGESELLRTVALLLHCPVPPLLDAA